MIHTYSVKAGGGGKGKRYRYYVCLSAQKKGWDTCPTKSVPAGEIERFVVEQIRAIGRDPAVLAGTLRRMRQQAEEAMADLAPSRRRWGGSWPAAKPACGRRSRVPAGGGEVAEAAKLAEAGGRISGIEQRLAAWGGRSSPSGPRRSTGRRWRRRCRPSSRCGGS